MSDRRIIIVDAPSPLGLWESGVERLPGALKAHQLLDKLAAVQGPILAPPAYSRERDGETGFLNGSAIEAYSRQLAAALAPLWEQDQLPLVLGGDCSILIGPALGLKRRGRFGLLFMDGHADYYRSDQSPTGEVADMDLAIVTGANHPLLSSIDGLQPYFFPKDVVAFGIRDEAEALATGSQDIRSSDISVTALSEIRSRGFEPCLDAALRKLTRPGLDGFFLHFDVDVLANAIMPAVDYRMDGGLTFEEAAAVLRAARRSGKLAGLTVTIFNPSLDPDGSIARSLADCIAAGLAPELHSA